MDNVRRLAGLVVTGEVIAAFSRAGKRSIEVSSCVPDTASFFTSYFDHSRNAYIVVFEDESFDMVFEGSVIPLLREPCFITELE